MAAATILAIAVATLIIHRAVTVEESDAMARLVRAYPTILTLGAATGIVTCMAALIVAGRDLAARRWVRAAWQVATAAGVIAASHVLIRGAWTGAGVTQMPLATDASVHTSLVGLVGAGVIWALRCWVHQSASSRGDLDDVFRRVRFAALGRSALTGCLLAWAVTTAVCLPVSWFALTRAVDENREVAGALLLSAAGVGTLSIVLSVGLAAIALVVVVLAKSGLLGRRVAPSIGLAAALFAIGYTCWGVHLSFGHELRAFGLQWVMSGSLIVLGLAWGVALSRHLQGLYQRGPAPRDVSEAVRTAVVAATLVWLLTPLHWLGLRLRPSRLLLAASCLTIAVILTCLIGSLFPDFEDFLDRIQFLLVLLILLFTVIAGRLLTPRAPRRWVPQAAALALIVLACLLPAARSQGELRKSRPRVFRYDPMGKYSLTLLDRFIPPGEGSDRAVAPKPTDPIAAADDALEELRRRRPLTILIIWDAARPDHMSLYGYKRTHEPILPTTPHLDAHKDQLLRFTRAYSQATATSCSLRNLFTGRYSSRWMLQTEGIAPYWTNDLLACGYHTLHLNILGSDYNGLSIKAFYRDMPADQKQRLAVFDCYACPPDNRLSMPADEQTYDPELPQQLATPPLLAAATDRPRMIECNRQNEGEAVADLLAFLATQTETGGDGVFAFIHMDATHTPWSRFEDVEDLGSGQVDRYDQTMRYSDLMTGRLIDGLKALGMWEQAILIIAADHGTGLNEHGRFGGYHPWHEQVRIPLIVKLPGVSGREIDATVGLFDVGPTLMDIAGPDRMERFEGRSLWPVITGADAGRPRVLFGLNSFADCYYLIDDAKWHYVRHRREQYEQLYDLSNDPTERRSLIERDEEATMRYRQYMNWFLNVQGAVRDYGNPYHYRGPDTPSE